uniref:Uncharacterized protein n=1 Tax=Triticum urartu TaxID=4572 RepID=A0A8R7ULN1_TRIUA
MAMEADDDDLWGAVTTSPSASPPPPSSAAAISTALSLNTRLQLLAATGVGGGSPFHPGGVGAGSPFHPGGGCYRNAAASPTSFFSLCRGLLPPHRARRRRPRAPRAGARDVLRPRRRRLARGPRRRRGRRRARGPAQEAHDQEPRVGVPLARAQAGPRHPDRVGGAPAARGERAAPPQVRPAQGFGGGVGAGEEDAAEGALGALLILLPSRGVEIEASSSSSHHRHYYYSHS